jgi:hypothetical protein
MCLSRKNFEAGIVEAYLLSSLIEEIRSRHPERFLIASGRSSFGPTEQNIKDLLTKGHGPSTHTMADIQRPGYLICTAEINTAGRSKFITLSWKEVKCLRQLWAKSVPAFDSFTGEVGRRLALDQMTERNLKKWRPTPNRALTADEKSWLEGLPRDAMMFSKVTINSVEFRGYTKKFRTNKSGFKHQFLNDEGQNEVVYGYILYIITHALCHEETSLRETFCAVEWLQLVKLTAQEKANRMIRSDLQLVKREPRGGWNKDWPFIRASEIHPANVCFSRFVRKELSICM